MQTKSSTIQRLVNRYSYSHTFLLGQGASGTVYRGMRTDDHLPIAVKVIHDQCLDHPILKYLLQNEIDASNKLAHQHIVRTYDVLRENGRCYIIMELCKGGTLSQHIKRKGMLGQREALQLFEKILDGYSAIAKARIIHRDLKNQNILLREDSSPVIVDFGFCEFIDCSFKPKEQYKLGSIAYMSPQAFNYGQYSVKSDIWSLGIMLYQMLNGKLPLLKVKQTKRYFQTLERFTYPPDLNMKYEHQITSKIILKALTVDVKNRASVDELKDLIFRWKKQTASPEKKLHQRVNSTAETPLLSSKKKKVLNYDLSSSTQQSLLKGILPRKEEREKQFVKLKRKATQGGEKCTLKNGKQRQQMQLDLLLS